MSKKNDKEEIEGEGFVIKDRRSSQISEDEAQNIPDEPPAKDLPSGADKT